MFINQVEFEDVEENKRNQFFKENTYSSMNKNGKKKYFPLVEFLIIYLFVYLGSNEDER